MKQENQYGGCLHIYYVYLPDNGYSSDNDFKNFMKNRQLNSVSHGRLILINVVWMYKITWHVMIRLFT